MADPYEWSEDREPRGYERGEQDARHAAERHAEQDRSWRPQPRRRQGGDYGAGWWGEEAAREGHSVPGPYGRPSEQRTSGRYEDPSLFDRYEDQDRRRGDRFAAEAERGREGLEQGWRRFSQGVRHAFDPDRHGAYEPDRRRAGGMFGGEDRPGSLFSHPGGAGGVAGRVEGPHRGKGPKGYVRSDARIQEDVSDRLADDGRLDASDIEVKVQAGEVTLNGQVASREDKRRAEDLAEQVSGVTHLQNNLRVRSPNAVAATAPGTRGSTGGAAGKARPS